MAREERRAKGREEKRYQGGGRGEEERGGLEKDREMSQKGRREGTRRTGQGGRGHGCGREAGRGRSGVPRPTLSSPLKTESSGYGRQPERQWQGWLLNLPRVEGAEDVST